MNIDHCIASCAFCVNYLDDCEGSKKKDYLSGKGRCTYNDSRTSEEDSCDMFYCWLCNKIKKEDCNDRKKKED